jgi:hemerythrin
VQRFEWSDEYSVGILQLDAQHRQIIDLLGEFKACVDSAEADKLVPAALDKVNAYARFHLEREELLLRVRGYPEYAGHKAEHDAYRQKVATLQSQLIRRDVAIRIANFLSEWWRYHILTSDQQYARFFRRVAAATPAREPVPAGPAGSAGDLPRSQS